MTKQKKKPPQSGTLVGINDRVASLRDWQWFAILAVLMAIFFRELIFQTAFLWEDFIYQFYPYRNFASVSFTNGEVPLWNPFTFSGMPFAADITGTTFYLPHFLLVPLVSGGKLNFWYVEMYILAHILLAGVTMFYCVKEFGLSKIPAVFSALAYMFSGFMITHIIHLVIICQAAWFPLVVLLFHRTLKNRSVISMILGGFVLSLIVCGGHIQITLYIFLFLLTFFVVEVFSSVREKQLNADPNIAKGIIRLSLFAMGIVVIAVGLGAIQLLPTNELTNYSVREEFSFARSTEGELWWEQLITILIPKFFGSSNALGAGNPSPYWGPESNWNFWETCIYTGIAAFTLALFALKYIKKNRYIAITAGFALFAILYALGDNFIIHGFFYNFIPGFSKFRSLGRWGFFFVFAVAFLSGFGLQELMNSKTSEKFFKKVIIILAGITLVITIAVQLHLVDSMIFGLLRTGAFRFESPRAAFPVAYEIAQNQTLISAAIVLGTLLILFLFLKRKLTPIAAVVLLFAIQFLDMYIFGFTHNNGAINPEDHFNQRANLVEQWKEEGKSEYFRINMRNSYAMLLDRNQGMIDRIFLLEGYSQLALQWRFPPGKGMHELLNTKYRVKTDTVLVQNQPRLQTSLVIDSAYLPRALFVYDYKTFPTVQQESLFISSDQFDPRKIVTLRESLNIELKDTGRSSWRAEIQYYTNNTIGLKVYTPKKGILVLSEIYCPGWNAYINGVPTHVYRADWSLRALVVNQGEHTVVLRYEPKSFYLGASISLSVFGLCAAGLAVVFWNKRKKHHLKNVTA